MIESASNGEISISVHICSKYAGKRWRGRILLEITIFDYGLLIGHSKAFPSLGRIFGRLLGA
eukprot:1372164-Amorphochlora_amoeboformis.AAC.1